MLGAALGRLRRDVSKVLGVGGVPGGANLPGRKVSRWCHSGSGDLSRVEVKPASRVPGALEFLPFRSALRAKVTTYAYAGSIKRAGVLGPLGALELDAVHE